MILHLFNMDPLWVEGAQREIYCVFWERMET